MPFVLILALALFQHIITDYLLTNPDYYQLGAYTWESDAFREMRLGEESGWLDGDFDRLALRMIQNDYDLTGEKTYDPDLGDRSLLMASRPADYRKIRNAYETILGDLKYFPIPRSTREESPEVTFENGWMDRRAYKSDDSKDGRGHEGCDIMGTGMPRGYYPVISISDGVVEKAGWLEMGGWRIGIRTPGGAYLYYAHLYEYSREFKEGDRVKAGELLGYMGDSGYGIREGTVGNFDVHLHLGIYLRTDHYEEMSVNPYWILKGLWKKRLAFLY